MSADVILFVPFQSHTEGHTLLDEAQRSNYSTVASATDGCGQATFVSEGFQAKYEQ